jgi:hypothetical protein
MDWTDTPGAQLLEEPTGPEPPEFDPAGEMPTLEFPFDDAQEDIGELLSELGLDPVPDRDGPDMG